MVKHAKATKILKKEVPVAPNVCELKLVKISVLVAFSENSALNNAPLKINPP